MICLKQRSIRISKISLHVMLDNFFVLFHRITDVASALNRHYLCYETSPVLNL